MFEFERNRLLRKRTEAAKIFFTDVASVHIVNICFPKPGHSPVDLNGIKSSDRKTCAREVFHTVHGSGSLVK